MLEPTKAKNGVGEGFKRDGGEMNRWGKGEGGSTTSIDAFKAEWRSTEQICVQQRT